MGAMPIQKAGEGIMPIFFFINAKHEEPTFRQCLSKFFGDVRKIRDQTPSYHKKKVEPYQVITDMSLVLFRPCIGK